MQRQGRINKLEQQQPCLHRNAELSYCHRASFVSSGAAPGQSLNYPILAGGTFRLRSQHTLACLGSAIAVSSVIIIAARANRQDGQAALLFGLTVHDTARYPPLRCRNSGACSLVFAAAACCCSAPVAGWASLSSPPAPRGWQPLAMTTRLTCVHTEQSSHRLSHEACSVDLPSHPRFANGSSHRLRRRACMHSRCPVCADTRMRA